MHPNVCRPFPNYNNDFTPFGVSHSAQPSTVSTYPHSPTPMHVGMTLVGLKPDHQQCMRCCMKCYTLIHIGTTNAMGSCCLPSLCAFKLINCLYIWSVPNEKSQESHPLPHWLVSPLPLHLKHITQSSQTLGRKRY